MQGSRQPSAHTLFFISQLALLPLPSFRKKFRSSSKPAWSISAASTGLKVVDGAPLLKLLWTLIVL